LTVALEGYLYYLRHKPKLIIFGSANRIVPWFARLKRLGLLSNVKLLATTQSYLQDSEVLYLDKVIIFSRREIGLRATDVQHKYYFIPLPADGDFYNLSSVNEERPYIFTGGGAGRDFASLIDAVRELDVLLKIVTFSPQSLNYTGRLPDNCQVYWKMPRQEFLQIMAGARFVVVPLKKGEYPHGHTTIVQALRMGKAVITNENASADDYVENGRNGLLIPAGDSSAYRQAIETVWHDHALRQSFEDQAKTGAFELTYTAYADRLTRLCQELIG
jgi:glycosyltransferase involved in cell wall biosynthesis